MRAVYLIGANGFPIAMYRPLLNRIENLCVQRNIPVIDNRGKKLISGGDVFSHASKAPDWSGMVEAVISQIESHSLQPIIGIGHSLG